MTRGVEQHIIGSHIRRAHRTIKGEHQLAQYVARLSLNECAEILSVSNIGLSSLATRHPECRVPKEEKRSFEDVIRIWTLYVLSGAEGG